jgi:hypothetical protein
VANDRLVEKKTEDEGSRDVEAHAKAGIRILAAAAVAPLRRRDAATIGAILYCDRYEAGEGEQITMSKACMIKSALVPLQSSRLLTETIHSSRGSFLASLQIILVLATLARLWMSSH